MPHLQQLDGATGPFYQGGQPLIGYLGSMTAGTGITTGSGTVYRSWVYQMGPLIYTDIYVDLTGLNSSTAGDIIGKDGGTANCHLGQVTTALNGRVFKGSYWCAEVPAGGEPDIDVYYATEGTGAEDVAISTLAEIAMKEAAADFTAVGQGFDFITVPPTDKYIYLVSSGGGDAATYTAGQFWIHLVGDAQ